MTHLLVIRNSAMGDVALTVPAVKAVLGAYPDIRITMLSHGKFAPFFYGIDRLEFFGADLSGEHKGLLGIWRLISKLNKLGPFDKVLDLHSVIRSWMITFHFAAKGVPVVRIDKGRREKKALTRRQHKIFKRLKPSYERYADVFARAGFPVVIGEGPWIADPQYPRPFMEEAGLLPKKEKWIGIAPFSRHHGKNWPEGKVQQLVMELAAIGYRVFLFGGGEKERFKLEQWASHPLVRSLAGQFSLKEELGVIQQMDVMVSMDSANLHMASLVGTPTVSIWGSTHSHAGFEPLGGGRSLKVEIDPADLTCRPCSVFGNKPCFRGDYACLQWIEVGEVKTKIHQVLDQ